MGMHVTGVLLIGAYLVRVCLMDMNSYGHTSLWASIRERVSYGRVPLIRHVCQGHILHEHASQVTFLAQFSGRNQAALRDSKETAVLYSKNDVLNAFFKIESRVKNVQ
jgi:hypothetical protein